MRRVLGSLVLAVLIATGARAQQPEKPLRIFGYFQNSYEHQTISQLSREEGSFVLQQLNLFFQKDISNHWRAFVNFEFINSFSSQQQWGTANLEEAWVRYRPHHYLNLRLGLQIPIFNNFNEVKNRTPLLPYVIRPIMYETAFSQLIDVRIAVPYRTFAQLYGYAPMGHAKFDYAVFLGNSPNLNSDAASGTTGRDTTASFLVGGRIGIRSGDLKAGVSGTYDRVNEPVETSDGPSLVRGEPQVFVLDRGRLGADLSFRYKRLTWESEMILVDYENPEKAIGTDSQFYYGTLGLQATDNLFVYGTGWLTRFNGVVVFPGRILIGLVVDESLARIDVGSFGAAYTINDSVILKAQVAEVEISANAGKVEYKAAFEYFATAVSVRF